MQTSHMESLLALARRGFSVASERMPAAAMCDAASAVAAGESWLAVERERERAIAASAAGEKPAGG